MALSEYVLKGGSKGDVAHTHARRNVAAAALKAGKCFLSNIFFTYNLNINSMYAFEIDTYLSFLTLNKVIPL